MRRWMMMLAAAGSLWVGAVEAADEVTFRQPLWPDLAPGQAGQDDGDVPELWVRLVAADQPTAGVVILPGGGYGGHALDHEGHQFAEWFASIGISSAICTYRLRGKGNSGNGYGHPFPMLDAQRAIQTLRGNAAAWNLDPQRIGVIGFSAGGHLASTVSTKFVEPERLSEDLIARVSSRPDFAILCYPVIGLGKPYTHQGSQRNLLGDDPDPQLLKSLSNEAQVSRLTPPTFLFHTAADRAVPVENSSAYFQACRQHGVPVELHVFPAGRHGLGLAAGVPGAEQWPQLCADWLRRLGMVTRPID